MNVARGFADGLVVGANSAEFASAGSQGTGFEEAGGPEPLVDSYGGHGSILLHGDTNSLEGGGEISVNDAGAIPLGGIAENQVILLRSGGTAQRPLDRAASGSIGVKHGERGLVARKTRKPFFIHQQKFHRGTATVVPVHPGGTECSFKSWVNRVGRYYKLENLAGLDREAAVKKMIGLASGGAINAIGSRNGSVVARRRIVSAGCARELAENAIHLRVRSAERGIIAGGLGR